MNLQLPPLCQHSAYKQNNDTIEREGFFHKPVLSQEVIDFLKPQPGAVFLDGTLGGGGHALLLLQAGATVIGCDRDKEALMHARERLASFGDRFLSIESNYADIPRHLASMGIKAVDGVLLDLGVSSYQLDTPERGFSFQKEGPLDMRMGLSPRTAAEIINTAELSELVHIFRAYGEEPRAVTLAKRIISERSQKLITTTTELAALVARGVRPGPRHPATRIFQALRIAVNEEIEGLERALPLLSELLASKGRLAVISFHSLEDRIIKHFLRKHSVVEVDDPTWPAPRPNPYRLFNLLTPRSITASEEELHNNPRSRSARLRVAEKL
ncbi:MAG TPA: 16S rRNA (cytosine(1402)-N(4))-methyltransferase RsmH [Chthoniobacterales bacterium]|nr:16S rRNA (cytosine(1402)-N(4))-methyltransferase RsmH [Chthoniobacterales bacterium]